MDWASRTGRQAALGGRCRAQLPHPAPSLLATSKLVGQRPGRQLSTYISLHRIPEKPGIVNPRRRHLWARLIRRAEGSTAAISPGEGTLRITALLLILMAVPG